MSLSDAELEAILANAAGWDGWAMAEDVTHLVFEIRACREDRYRAGVRNEGFLAEAIDVAIEAGGRADRAEGRLGDLLAGCRCGYTGGVV